MRYFDADALEFLGDLRRHNDRRWFNEHKERYERALREPFLEFIADAGPELRTISKHLVADPRPSGGSLFRIHRDVRFSKQNRPLKRPGALRARGAILRTADGYACAMRFLPALGLMLATACSGPPVEDGLFFPTWDAEGDVPAGQVQGVLVEEDRCLFVEANGRQTLVVWEAGLGFEDDALLDSAGDPIASVGETIHGGGGYYGDRGHIQNLAGEPIPERCVPVGDGDRFAVIYEVEAGPFE